MYEINHYLRILDGDAWCVDSPSHPSVQDVKEQIEAQNQKWLKSSSLEEKAYHDEVENTRKVLGSSTSLSEQKQQAVKAATMRLETYLEDVFVTSSNAAGKPYLRDYADGPKKDAPTQVDTIALKFRFTRKFVLSKANDLGITVLNSPPQPQPDPAQAGERKQPAQPPSWVWNAGKNEVDSKFGKTTWDIPRVRLDLIPGRPEDLYRFLGKTNGSSIQDLACARQEALGLWDSAQAPGKTANQNECGKKLCASAELWLGTENDKALYDAMLRLDHGGVFDFLWDILNHWTEKVGGITVISDDLWDEAVRRVRKNTRSNEEAEWLVWYQLSEKKKCKCLPPDISGLLGEIARLLANNQFQTAYEVAERALKKSPNDKTAQEYLHQAEEALAKELAAASAAIQAAVDSGDYSAARRKVDETARRNLPGFKADEWRQKIKDAEAEAERKRKEREERERQDKIDAATRKFDEAILAAKWDEAERLTNELARLGERPIDKWRKKIADAKDNRRSTLEDGCRKALADFNGSFPANLQAAEAALDRANVALAALEKEFRSSPIIGSTRNAIAKGQEDVAAKKRENVLNELRPVQSLTATGSADGNPTVAISWKPGSGGTQVAKWQVWRREKGMSGKGVKLGEFAGTETKREDSRSDLKIGVEYEYGVMPMAEIEGTFKPNEKAVVWSAPAVCLVRLPDNALSGTGQGMEGVGGVVTLKWKMPEGVPSGAPHRLFLSRGDGKFSDMDVTDFKELFEDTSVSIDATLEYSLRFELCGRDMGTSKKRISVEKVPPPPSVGKITFGRNAQGSLLAKWDWPAGLDSCIWGVTTDKANSPADIPKISRNPVSKRTYAEKGGVVAKPLDGGGSCWISVFGARTFGDKEFYSAGRCAPLGETKLAYAIDAHPGGLFLKRKPAFLVIKSSTGYFPELDVRASRIRADVLSPRGGRSVLRTESETGMAEKRIPLDGLVPPGEFVGVFLVHPETENCRIDPPSEFEVK